MHSGIVKVKWLEKAEKFCFLFDGKILANFFRNSDRNGNLSKISGQIRQTAQNFVFHSNI
jgi:hypothetical protein